MITEQSALETLRRVPDRIILATMGRDLNLLANNACLCGWFVREKLAEVRNVGASEITDLPAYAENAADAADEQCSDLFGGSHNEWEEIFYGVTHDDREDMFGDPRECDADIIERAFVSRVNEAVFGRGAT